MPRTHSKYFWPASALSASDMDLLYRAREASSDRTTITRLLAHAVRETFGHLASDKGASNEPVQLKEAA